MADLVVQDCGDRAWPMSRWLMMDHHRLGAPFVHHQVASGTRSRHQVYPVKPVDLQCAQGLKVSAPGHRSHLYLSHALCKSLNPSPDVPCVPAGLTTALLASSIFSTPGSYPSASSTAAMHPESSSVIIDCWRFFPHVHELGLL